MTISTEELHDMAKLNGIGTADGLLADLAIELLSARAKLEAAEKLAEAARTLAEGFRAMLEAGDVIRNLSAVGRASLTGEVLTAEAALSAWEAAQ